MPSAGPCDGWRYAGGMNRMGTACVSRVTLTERAVRIAEETFFADLKGAVFGGKEAPHSVILATLRASP